MDDRATVAPEEGRYAETWRGAVVGPFTRDPDDMTFPWDAGDDGWTREGCFRENRAPDPDNLRRLLPADWTPPPGWRSGDPLPEETDSAVYPEGITSADHIAHDMRAGRFPERSTVAAFLSQRAAPAPERPAEERAREAALDEALEAACMVADAIRREHPQPRSDYHHGQLHGAILVCDAVAALRAEAARLQGAQP